jgi:hypothetical protein
MIVQALEVLSSDHLTSLDHKLEHLDTREQLVAQEYMQHQYLGKVLHSSIIFLLRDVISTFRQG